MERTSVGLDLSLALAGALLAAPHAVAQAPCPGGFAAPVLTPIATPSGLLGGPAIALGDVNNDGRADAAVGTDNGVQIYLATGSGTFQIGAFIASPTPESVLLIDLNEDGWQDVFVATVTLCYVHLGGPQGAFTPGAFNPIGPGLSALVARDLDGDGLSDIVGALLSGATFRPLITRLDPSGGLSPFLTNGNFGGSSQGVPRALAVADCAGDARPDVVAATTNGCYLYRAQGLFGYGEGGAANGSPTSILLAPDVVHLALGELTGDGRTDIVLARSGSTSLFIGPGLQTGGFGTPLPIGIGGHPAWVVLEDVNDDGNPDIVAACPNQGNVSVRLGDGFGNFQPELTRGTSYPTGGHAAFVAAGRAFAQDGPVDLIVLNLNPPSLAVLPSTLRPPSISQQPSTLTVAPGRPAGFSIGVRGGGYTFQWRRNGQPLNQSSGAQGISSSTLTLPAVTLADTLSVFDCVVSVGCTQVLSAPAVLNIQPECIADFNVDGVVDPDDLSDYISAFFGGCD